MDITRIPPTEERPRLSHDCDEGRVVDVEEAHELALAATGGAMSTRPRTRSWERRAAARRMRLATVAAQAPQYAKPPADVRRAGWTALVAAAETTVDLGQIYARTLDTLWPLAVAAAQERVDADLALCEVPAELAAAARAEVDSEPIPVWHALVVPEPTEQATGIAVWGVMGDQVPIVFIDSGMGGAISLDGRRDVTADQAEMVAARLVAAARWVREAGEQR